VITETDGITLTDVDTADGAITINTNGATIVTDVAASGSGEEDDVAITAASGNITIDVVSAAGSGDVTIEATAGSINETGAGDAAVDITADALTLTAQYEIGGAGEMDIETTVASLDASSTTTGDIVITETDGLTLADVDTVGSDITITSTTGNIALADLDEVVSAGSGGNVILRALVGNITVAVDDNTKMEIKTSGSVTLTGAAIGGTNPLDIEDTTSLTIYDLDGSTDDIQIREQSASTIASTTITVPTATSGDIDITYSNGDSVDIDNGHVLSADLDQGISSFSYTADAGDIVVDAVDTGTNAASITATAGSINDDADDTIVDIAGGVVTLTARDEIGGIPTAGKTTDVSGAIETAVTSLDASSTSDGDIVITETDGIILTDVDTVDGAVTISAGGMITATDIVAGDAGDDERHDVRMTTTNGGMVLTSVVADDDIVCTADAGDLEVQNSLGAAGHGGVKLVADDGKIYTSGDMLNVNITGYSDDPDGDGTGIGVDLPELDGHKAAIVIWSKLQDLTLGSSGTLTAKGLYDPETVDDRSSVNFVLDGDPIDVAIYLGSFNHELAGDGGNVTVNSAVSIDPKGTMVIDAHDTVNPFESPFTDSWKNPTNRLEVVSRISGSLNDAIFLHTLPYASEASGNIAPPWFGGEEYVLRGPKLLAEVLAKVNPAPLAVPMPVEPEEEGEVEIGEEAEELELGEHPELARAYPPSLNTDLNLDKAAQRLHRLLPTIRDENRIVELDRIVFGIWQDAAQPITPEQVALIAQRIEVSQAKPWIAALMEYEDVLKTLAGWTPERSVGLVMKKYVIPLLDTGVLHESSFAYVEIQVEGPGS
jgi:hypothetical protein